MKAKKKNMFNIIFSALVILLPFLYQYKGIGNVVCLGEVLLIPFIVFYIIQVIVSGKIKNIDRSLLVFYVVAILLTFLNAFNDYFKLGSAISAIIRLFFYMILVYVARKHFDYKSIETFYFILILFFSVYLILQYALYYINGTYLPIYINYSWQFPPDARPESYEGIYAYGFRPSSLFLEASYFALFVLPGICILLFKSVRNKIELITLVVSSVAIVLSTSSAGLIGIGLLYSIKLFSSDKKTAKKFFMKIGGVILAVIAVLYILNAQNAYTLRSRMFSGGSIGQRVLRGFVVFSKLPLFHKIFGVGINNMEAYMFANNIRTIYDESNLNNCATITQVLVFFGLVGFAFFVVYIIRLILNSKGKVGLPLSILIVYIMSYEAVLFMYRFAFLIIILEAVNRCERKEEII